MLSPLSPVMLTTGAPVPRTARAAPIAPGRPYPMEAKPRSATNPRPARLVSYRSPAQWLAKPPSATSTPSSGMVRLSSPISRPMSIGTSSLS